MAGRTRCQGETPYFGLLSQPIMRPFWAGISGPGGVLGLGRTVPAGAKLTVAFTTELYVAQQFQVIEPGAFRAIKNSTLERPRHEATELTPEELQSVGAAAGVQGIFQGIVRDYEMARIGAKSYPLITLEVRLLDAATGQVVWSNSVTKRGGPKFPIFGWGEVHTLGELASDAAREVVGGLAW